MEKQYSIAEARNRLSDVVHAVEKGGPVTLTRRGRPVAVLVSEADFTQMAHGKKDYWEALQEFRATHDLIRGALTDADFAGLRDKGGGRDFAWDKP